MPNPNTILAKKSLNLERSWAFLFLGVAPLGADFPEAPPLKHMPPSRCGFLSCSTAGKRGAELGAVDHALLPNPLSLAA